MADDGDTQWFVLHHNSQYCLVQKERLHVGHFMELLRRSGFLAT